MAKGKLLNIFSNNLEGDSDYSHIKKEVKKSKKDRVVSEAYSSGSNKILTPSKHSLFFRKEKRRGKIVTMIGYFQLNESDKKELLRELKKKLSCGGSIRENFLEFQGDIEDKAKEELIKKEFKFRTRGN